MRDIAKEYLATLPKPDSLLDAAKKVAVALRTEWSTVHKFYRALQGEPAPWLPTSLGRNIWAATPEYVARLLIAVGAADDVDGAKAAVEWTRQLTRAGRDWSLMEKDTSPVELEIQKYLIDESESADLVNIEFLPDLRRVVFREQHRTRDFLLPLGEPLPNAPALQRRGVISGGVLQELSHTVAWRLQLQPSLKKVKTGTVDPEA